MRNHRITTFSDLLYPNGTLMQKGYSTKAVMRYNRKHIKAPPWRIKEWDFYQVSNDDYCLQLTIGHASYAGEVSAMLIDLNEKKHTPQKKSSRSRSMAAHARFRRAWGFGRSPQNDRHAV